MRTIDGESLLGKSAKDLHQLHVRSERRILITPWIDFVVSMITCHVRLHVYTLLLCFYLVLIQLEEP